MSDKPKHFIDTYLEYTEMQESPTNYHIWSALSIASACMRRMVWVNMGYFKVFPNMFVVLVGPPGRCRKTVAINIATGLIENIPDIIISPDAITREALIKDLDGAARMGQVAGEPYTHSSLTIVSKELSVFLGTGNHDLLSLLTDLYDCPIRWEYKTKGSGTNRIEKVWLNMLAASTPTWLVGSIPLTAIGGGFTSRVIFVVEDDVRRRNARPIFTNKELALADELRLMLEKISMCSGEMVLTPDASEFFERWYNNENVKLDDSRFAGYSERKHIHALKVATILSICESMEGKIRSHHLDYAIRLLSEIEGRMVKAFGAVGRSPIAMDIDEIMTIMQGCDMIERYQLMKHIRMNVHPREFDTCMKLLIDSGDIALVPGPDGKVLYKLIRKEE